MFSDKDATLDKLVEPGAASVKSEEVPVKKVFCSPEASRGLV